MINPSIMFLMDRPNVTLSDIIVVGIVCGVFWMILLGYAIIRHIQRAKSSADVFARKLEIIVGLIALIAAIGMVIASLYTAYVGNETSSWLTNIIWILFATLGFFMCLAEITRKISFYDDKVVWVNFFGLKRVYKYDEITDCFYGRKGRHLFVQIEFNGQKRLDMRMDDRLESTLKKRKIRISNAKDFR